MENKAVYLIVLMVVGIIWLLAQANFVNDVYTKTRNTENSSAIIDVCQRVETYRCDPALIGNEKPYLNDCGKVFPPEGDAQKCIDGCRNSGYCKEFIKP